MKKIVFTFGRYNPPTTGHAELINYTASLARKTGADHRIYTSQSHDPSKNPLAPRQKIAFLRQIFPGVNFVEDPSMKTAFAICKKLADEGYEDVTFVVGSDRVDEFKTQLGKYVKPKTAKDFNPKINYPFKKFQVVSSGARKKGISGTDLRNAVRRGDFATFARASAARDKALAKKIFATTKAQLNEEMTRKEFDSHLKRFIDFTCQKLDIQNVPSLKYKEPDEQGEQPSFAAYSPGDKEVIVMTKNRHPMDVFRSVAHELVHHKQNEDGKLGKDIAREGATGSDIENEANARAGELMRWYGKANPQCFSMSYVTEEEQIDELSIPTMVSYSKSAKSERNDLNKYRLYDNSKQKEKDNRKFKNRTIGLSRAYDKIEKKKEAQKPSPGQKRAAIWAKKRKIKDPEERRNTHFSGDLRYRSMEEQKAIILGGVPGSGKDKILKEAILPHGFREVSDNKFSVKECNGDNLVVNGTMADYQSTKNIKSILESAGYRTIMVFVNTSNDVSRQRNEARATTGGRVIAEDVRYDKWRRAQINLNLYDQLFEKVIEVTNDLDANTIRETYDQFVKSISKEIGEFAINESDVRFEQMLEGYSDFGPKAKNNPVGGAGNWGTPKLTDRYKSDTPGQEPGKTRAMGYYAPKVFGNLPLKGDRIGATYTSAKNPSFVGDITGDVNPFVTPEPMQLWSPIDRWMVKEETRKKFKEKYGKLAEQKMKETAEKVRKESLVDPYMGSMGMTPNSMNQDDVRPDINAEFEKMSLFGKRKSKKTK